MAQRIFDAYQVHDEPPSDFPVPATSLARAVLRRKTGWGLERDGKRAYVHHPGWYGSITQRQPYGAAEDVPDEFHADLRRDCGGGRWSVDLNRRGGVYTTAAAAARAIERHLAAAKALPENEVPTSIDVWGGSHTQEDSHDVLNVWHRVPARLVRKGEVVAAA